MYRHFDTRQAVAACLHGSGSSTVNALGLRCCGGNTHHYIKLLWLADELHRRQAALKVFHSMSYLANTHPDKPFEYPSKQQEPSGFTSRTAATLHQLALGKAEPIPAYMCCQQSSPRT